MTYSFDKEDVKHLHLEISSLCNAACMSCPRFFRNTPWTRPGLETTYWTLEDFKTYLPLSFLSGIRSINMCGNHGDPGTCKDLLPIVQYLDSIKLQQLRIHTNVGMKQPELWSELGKIFAKNDLWLMIFSVDGLEDTNHIYRRNVKWNKVEANIKAYTQHGGMSQWDYLIFQHNEHQIEEARQCSKEWGIDMFVPKKAIASGDRSARDKDGKHEYFVHPPSEENNKNNFNDSIFVKRDVSKIDYKEIVDRPINENAHPGKLVIDEEWDKVEIIPRCEQEIYIDASGNVMPCCWSAISLPMMNEMKKDGSFHGFFEHYQMDKRIKEVGGLDKLSLRVNSIHDVLDSGVLKDLFSDHWDKTTECGKMAICSKTCGQKNVLDDIYTHEGNENPYYYSKMKKLSTKGVA